MSEAGPSRGGGSPGGGCAGGGCGGGGARSKTRRLTHGLMKAITPRRQTGYAQPTSPHSKHGSPVKAREHHTYPKYAEQILQILREKDCLNPDLLKYLKTLLDHCSTSDPVLRYLDHKGCDIVQRTVQKGFYDFLEYILVRGYNPGFQDRPCSSPLHLACKKGNIPIIKLLLDHGADITHKSRACAHLHSTYSYDGMRNHPITYRYFTCSDVGNKHCPLTPIQVALICDKLDVLETLITYDHPKGKLKTSTILLDACKYGAEKCLRYLVERFPEQTQGRDNSGRSALTIAFHKSEACGKILLEHGRNWSEDQWLNASGRQESLLHVIMHSEIEHPYDILQLVFKAGYKNSYLCVRDRSGCTPMHVLMRQVGKRASLHTTGVPADAWKYPTDDLSKLRDRLQDDRDEQVFECIKFMYDHGADLEAVNNSGESVLHLLICDNYYRRLHGMRAGYYNSVLPQVNRVLEYMLNHGVDVNTYSNQVSTPLTWAVHVLCSMESYEVENVWPGILYGFSLLCKHGADPNIPDEKGISIITLILTAVNRWISQCDTDTTRALTTLSHMQDLFTLFFRHDLDPSDDVIDLCTKQVAILCNINGSDGSFLPGVRNLLIPFFTAGINPNTSKMVIETEDNYAVPCKLHAQFYLARSFIIHRRDGLMFDFFSIFENSLDRECYNSLLNAICKILAKNFEDNISYETTKCIRDLNAKKQCVRTLKQLVRISIAKSLNWKLTQRVPLLPLPRLMKSYLLDL